MPWQLPRIAAVVEVFKLLLDVSGRADLLFFARAIEWSRPEWCGLWIDMQSKSYASPLMSVDFQHEMASGGSSKEILDWSRELYGTGIGIAPVAENKRINPCEVAASSQDIQIDVFNCGIFVLKVVWWFLVNTMVTWWLRLINLRVSWSTAPV